MLKTHQADSNWINGDVIPTHLHGYFYTNAGHHFTIENVQAIFGKHFPDIKIIVEPLATSRCVIQ